MTEDSVPQGTDRACDGAPVATAAFCELVARDMGVKLNTARTAFLGEPTRRALGVMAWAMDKSEDPEERSRMVLAWARKRRAGAFRPVTDEYASLAGSVGHGGEEAHYRENEKLARLLAYYWHQNPRRLARVLDELEIWVNVRGDETADDGRS